MKITKIGSYKEGFLLEDLINHLNEEIGRNGSRFIAAGKGPFDLNRFISTYVYEYKNCDLCIKAYLPAYKSKPEEVEIEVTSSDEGKADTVFRELQRVLLGEK